MIKGKISVVIFFLFGFSSHGIKYPVFLIPGDGGSQLEAKLNKPSVVLPICRKKTDDYISLWFNLEYLIPEIVKCFVDNIRLVYNQETRTTSNSPGVDIRVPDFGNTLPVEWIDKNKAPYGSYYNAIADMLVDLGYERNVTLRGAPYDFRKGAKEQDQYFLDLKNLIELTYEANGQQKIILIAHSLGVLMMSAMLRKQPQDWKDKYIKLMIAISGPWGGTVKAVKLFATGDNFGIIFLPNSALRPAEINFPSTAWLLPSPYFWNAEEILVQTSTKNYSLSNLQDFFSDMNYSYGWEMYNDALPFLQDFTPLGVELHGLYAYGVPTIERLDYEDKNFPNGEPKLIMGDGDGAVNQRSLRAFASWTSLPNQKIFEVGFKNTEHTAILASEATLAYIKQLINGLD